MPVIALGGGSSAVAASSHAACARFRGTDPLITARTRRQLARELGHPDDSGTIPDARWIRAITFETLIQSNDFAAQIATTTVGALGLARPAGVVIVNAKTDPALTLDAIREAHTRATTHQIATLIHAPAVPHPGFDTKEATTVLPDFVVVTSNGDSLSDAWLIVGDAKDYERVRSRIDDQRMLKGYLQVAFGAEAFDRWADRPIGVSVHRFGVLAVPRNSFLQPTTVTEDLADHRTEVRKRLEQRHIESEAVTWAGEASDFVAHLKARFDPAACSTCSLFAFCRAELRASTEWHNLLIEIGIPEEVRPLLAENFDAATEPSSNAPASKIAQLRATLSGRPVVTGQRRLDPIGQVGTVNLVLVKSDSAALGVHGVSIQVVDRHGPGPWSSFVFNQPQTDATRRQVAEVIGSSLAEALRAVDGIGSDPPLPIHIVVPDQPTSDLLASIADTLAGVEVSRLRWERDVEVGREPVTFDGQPASIPAPLTPEERLGVSFLLEEDRARAFLLRSPVVDIRAALTRLLVPGGPSGSAGRLDYVVGWARALTGDAVEHRAFADEIEQHLHTPGARLTSSLSNAIFKALTDSDPDTSGSDPERYRALVEDALTYRRETFDAAVEVLANFESSALATAVRAIEGDAQVVWRRRWELQAFDLIRFGLTPRIWRNSLVNVIEADTKADAQIAALTNPQRVDERARDAGARELAIATVVSTDPLRLEIDSRRLVGGTTVVALQVNGLPAVESPVISTKLQKGSVKIGGMRIGPLMSVDGDEQANRFDWHTVTPCSFEAGDELVIADADWFGTANRSFIKIARPAIDVQMAPQESCSPESYARDPEGHQWCCQPHVAREAWISDEMAARRERGQLNPQTWPPVLDADAFDVTGTTDTTAESVDVDPIPLPYGATADEFD